MPAPEFTVQEVHRIRSLFDAKHSGPAIARLFPTVGIETLRRIGRRETYRHVPEAIVDANVLADEAAASLERIMSAHARVLEDGTPAQDNAVDNFLALRSAPTPDDVQALFVKHAAGTPLLGDILVREMADDKNAEKKDASLD